MSAHDETPARRLGRRDESGCLVLRESDISWQHGAEAATARALETARDLSDMSDELAEAGALMPAAFDCARERGHLLRPLELDDAPRVLEVGAGCGAVTRSLAERCSLVDALEPNPLRARLAARRLADIDSARVLIGEIGDIPAEPTYDLIVIVGVLEYVGGWRGHDERVSFLRSLAARLRPGGHVVCAIENRFGTRYFAGQPDDHSGMLFQGVEDHPRPYPARTYARPELERLFTAADLRPTTFGVFPDYRLPRLVFADALLDSAARPLAWRVPSFPTPPHPSYRGAAVLDERRLWQGLASNGMGAQFPNSLLVVAAREGEQALWPPHLLAAFYSAGRKRRFATETRVLHANGAIELRRRRLAAGDGTGARFVQRTGSEPYHDGTALTELLAESDDEQLSVWLRRYRSHLEAELAITDRPVPFDHWPGNLIVVDDRLIAVDTELALEGMDPNLVIWRALLLTALDLADRTVAERWSSATRAELVAELARAAGIDGAPRLTDAIELQADIYTEIFGGDPSEAIDALTTGLAQPLTANVFGSRDAGPGLHARFAEAEAQRDEAIRREGQLQTALDAQSRERARLESALATIEHSNSWRLTAPLRAVRRRAGTRS
jgi:SAM-dependent methyltransferase